MSKTYLVLVLVCIIVTGAVFGGAIDAARAATNALTPGEVLAAVNALRQSRGLPDYKSDGTLKAYAQQHAEYMAKTGNLTHTHSDGTRPWEHGIAENIAFGSSGMMEASFVVNQAWADEVHMKTMTYASGVAGVGVASNGDNVYISLDVRAGAEANVPAGTPLPTLGTPVKPSATPPGYKAPTATSNIIVPVKKATPGPDGSIIHEVQSGQSLWAIAIAYGVKIADIRRLNGIPENSNNIVVGQKLVIQPVVMTLTPTSAQPAGGLQPASHQDAEETASVAPGETTPGESMDAPPDATARATLPPVGPVTLTALSYVDMSQTTPAPGEQAANPQNSTSLSNLPLAARSAGDNQAAVPERTTPGWVYFIGYHAETIVMVIFVLAALGIMGLFILGVRKK